MEYTQLLLIALLITNVACQKYAGEPCVHVKQATNGVCRAISDCPSAITDLHSNIMPQTCGFVGTVAVVCCPSNKPEIIDRAPVTTGAKSLQQCKEYAKQVYQTVVSPILTFKDKNETVNVCGHTHVKLIVGGVKANGKEFPHMAAVGYDSGGERIYVCGGSLISENFVITAGHCLVTRDYGDAKYVRVGDLDLKQKNDDADPQEFNVIERIRHPEYVPPSQYNDIGLLRLEKNIRFSAYVRPICLNYDTTLHDEKAMATGWGTTAHLGNSSDHLLKVTLDLFSYDDCKGPFKVNKRKLAKGIDDATQMCAGSKTEQKDSCQGDSGGPLQVYHDDSIYCMYKLLGVTSFGIACGIARNPGVYTRVSHYVPWIETVVWP